MSSDLAEPAAVGAADMSVAAAALSRLTQLFAEIEAKQRSLSELTQQSKRLEAEIDTLETQAVDVMTVAEVRSMTAGTRRWSLRRNKHVSILKGSRDAVLAAAAEIVDADGVSLADEIRTVLTGTLKSWLSEQAKLREAPPESPLADGTPFAGLVSEYETITLTSVSAG
jgi:hypothetical protein